MPPLAGFYDEVLLNSQGVLYSLKNASVLVKNLNGTNAVLYASADMTTTASNPVQADSLGNVTFWAENGQYDLVVTPQGGTAQPAYRVRTTVAPGTAVRLAKHDQVALTAFDRWDDFNRANGPLTTRALMPSGQTWTIGSTEVGNGSVVIRNDRLVFDVAGATYIRVGGQGYRRISATFSFGDGTTNSATATLVSSKMPVSNIATGATGIATNSVHASFAGDNWNVGIFDGTALRVFASNTLDVAYAALPNNAVVEAAIELVDIDRLRIHLPDGQAVEVTDALIQSRTALPLRLRDWWGATALIEHYQPSGSFATDRRPAFHGFGVAGTEVRIPSSVGIPRRVGWWLHAGTVPTNVATSLNVLYVMPALVNAAGAVDLASLNVTAAAAGAVLRAVVYADSGLGYPGALLWEGTLDGTAVATPEVAAAFTLPAGLVWLGAVAQTAAPTVTFALGASHLVGTPAKPVGTYTGALFTTAVSGAAPATFPANASGTNGAPRLSLRMA